MLGFRYCGVFGAVAEQRIASISDGLSLANVKEGDACSTRTPRWGHRGVVLLLITCGGVVILARYWFKVRVSFRGCGPGARAEKI